MKELVEVIPFQLSTDSAIASSINFLSSVGFNPILANRKSFPGTNSLLRFEVLSGRIDGYIYDRLYEPVIREAFFCLQEGASASEIDNVLRERVGIAPFQHILERGFKEGKTHKPLEVKALMKSEIKEIHNRLNAEAAKSVTPRPQPSTLPERQNPDDEDAPAPLINHSIVLNHWFSALPLDLQYQSDYITGIKDTNMADGFKKIEIFRKINVSY